MADLGIGVKDANIELGTFRPPPTFFSCSCRSILFIPCKPFLFASSFSSGLDGGVMGFDCAIDWPTKADNVLLSRVVFTATGIGKEFCAATELVWVLELMGNEFVREVQPRRI